MERSQTERNLITAMEHNINGAGEVVAVGIVEVRAAERLVREGLAEHISESHRSVDQWGAGSMRIRLAHPQPKE